MTRHFFMFVRPMNASFSCFVVFHKYGIVMLTLVVAAVVMYHHIMIVASYSPDIWLKYAYNPRNNFVPRSKNQYNQRRRLLLERRFYPSQTTMTKRRYGINFNHYNTNEDDKIEIYQPINNAIQIEMQNNIDWNPNNNQSNFKNDDETNNSIFRFINNLMYPIRIRRRERHTNLSTKSASDDSRSESGESIHIVTPINDTDKTVQAVEELLIPYRLGLYPYIKKKNGNGTNIIQSRKQQSIRNKKGIIETIFGTKSNPRRLLQPARLVPKLSTHTTTTNIPNRSILSTDFNVYDGFVASKTGSTENSTSNTTSQSTDVLNPDNNLTNSEDLFWKFGNETIEAALNVLSSLPFGTVILTGGNTTSSNNTINIPEQILSNYSNYTTEFSNFMKPFLEMMNTNTNIASSGSSTMPRKPQSVQWDNRYNALVSGIETLLETKNPNDVLTVGDLQLIIRDSATKNQHDNTKKQQHLQQPASVLMKRMTIDDNKRQNEGGGSTSTTSKRDKSLVAFPQPSVLSPRALTYGCVASGSTFGIIAGISILPNLWLVGAILGSIYGYETGKNYSKVTSTSDAGDSTFTKANQNLVQAMIILLGRRIATNYLILYDYYQYLFFMYKTGQLSYEYYKTYATLDSKFAIQAKIDAWNARFAEGKVAFDQWEKENEIGRKVLAGLRTIWLVEERSLKKQSRLQNKFKSKYRLVQFGYDVLYSIQRVFKETWVSITARNDIRLQEIKEFWKGIFVKLDRETIRARINSSITAALVVAITGSLFTIFPQVMIAISVVLGGIIWPSWFSEFYSRCNGYLNEIRARGRGENVVRLGPNRSRKREPYNPNLFMQLLDLTNPTSSYNSKTGTRYHYYRKVDGTKRYYRVGKPSFGGRIDPNSNYQNRYVQVDGFRWPWEKPPIPRKKQKWIWFRP